MWPEQRAPPPPPPAPVPAYPKKSVYKKVKQHIAAGADAHADGGSSDEEEGANSPEEIKRVQSTADFGTDMLVSLLCHEAEVGAYIHHVIGQSAKVNTWSFYPYTRPFRALSDINATSPAPCVRFSALSAFGGLHASTLGLDVSTFCRLC
jgi:hypothetical protein